MFSFQAMVLHYLVRVEPFSTLHVELQSGRFDVADRQFHSIPQTWKSLFDNLNDVKELIPEFFYFPEFLVNENNFDLGKLQGGKKARVNDVLLPRWAKSADDFVRQHRLALESDYVSNNLHHWIDLIFGFKQQGEAAVKALNVFYYCTYEGAVNLDAIEDAEEREAVEGMINNFGQTPCQLLRDPHPKRMSREESLRQIAKAGGGKKRADLMACMPDWKPYLLDLSASNEKDPLVFINAPRWKRHNNQHYEKAYIPSSGADTLITISSSGIVGTHGWLPYDRNNPGGGSNNDFTFDLDPTFESSSKSQPKRKIPTSFAPGIPMTSRLFVTTSDGKHIISGGHWDNSVRVYSLHKSRTVASVVRHIDIVTCVAASGHYLITGSRDTTSIVWDLSASVTQLRPAQVLAGHDKAVRCVALCCELDMAASGSEDGTVNIYTIKEGQFLRTLRAPQPDPEYWVDRVAFSPQGHTIIAGHSRDVHSLHTYSLNGRFLKSDTVLHRITALLVADGDHVISGDENGDLVVRDLFTFEILHKLHLQLPIQGACLVSGNSHLLVPLRDGKLIIVGSKKLM